MENKNSLNNREVHFTNYFCLSVYTMRVAKFCLEMAKDYCARPALKNTLRITEHCLDSKIADVMLKLKPEARSDLLYDLQSDDLQALGNILHHIIQLPSISDGENALLDFIRELKKNQNAQLEPTDPGTEKESGNDSGLQNIATEKEERKEDEFSWPVIPKKW